MKKLILIDGNALIYRAFYGTSPNLQNIMRSSDGTPTNALLGFARMIEPIVCNEDNVLVALDSRGATFRHNAYKEYKGTRGETPIELLIQKPLIIKYLNNRGIPHYYEEGFEADDVIAAMARKAEKEKIQVNIYSSDRDLLQLVSKYINVCLIKNGMRNIIVYNKENFYKLIGVDIDQFRDYKALVGDSSDNIKGVQGVGPKTSIKLLKEYRTIEGIYKNLDKLTPKTQEKFRNFEKRMDLVRMLVSLRDDFNMDIDLEFTKVKDFDVDYLYSFLKKYQITSFRIKKQEYENDKPSHQTLFTETMTDEFLNVPQLSLFIKYSSLSYHINAIKGLVSIFNGHDIVVTKAKDFFNNKKLLNKLSSVKRIYTNNAKCIWYYALYFHVDVKAEIIDLNLMNSIIKYERGLGEKILLANYKSDNQINTIELFKGNQKKKR